MKCSFCSAKISPDACFCERCGRQVGDEPINRLVLDNAHPKEEKEKSLVWPLIGFVVSIIGICLCVYFSSEIFVEFYAFIAENLAHGSLMILGAAALLIFGGVSLVKVVKRL